MNRAGWRTEAESELDRLEVDRDACPPGPGRDEATALINAARSSLAADGDVVQWWTGGLIEHTWSKLFLAREALVLAQEDSVVRAQLPYLLSLVPATDTVTAAAIHQFMGPTATMDRDVLRQVLVQHHVSVSIAHGAVRKLRNTIYVSFAVLLLALAVTGALVDPMLRIVMGLGALAGLASSVLTLTTASAVPGPFGLVLPQVLLKIAAGSLTALLAVLILVVAGLAQLKTGSRGAFAYAVIFGFAQQAFTQLVDTQIKELAR